MVRKKYLPLFITIVSVTVLIDQILKYLVLTIKPNVKLGFLSINLIFNTGAGFGILQEQTFLLTLVSLLVILIIVVFYKKIPQEKNQQILFALFLGGVMGNFIDRFVRNYVIDFINFSFWPAFNVADATISLATIGLIIYYWKN